MPVPALAASPTTAAWALVPLLHYERLVGVVVLARPPVARRLDWEDFDLLRVVGRQLASYLAEAREPGGAGRGPAVRRVQPPHRLRDARHQEPRQPALAARAQCRAARRQSRVPRRHAGDAARARRQAERPARAPRRTARRGNRCRRRAVALQPLLDAIAAARGTRPARGPSPSAEAGAGRWPIRRRSSRRWSIWSRTRSTPARPAMPVVLDVGVREREARRIEVIDPGSGHGRRVRPHPAVQAVRLDQGRRLRHRRVRGARADPRDGRPARRRDRARGWAPASPASCPLRRGRRRIIDRTEARMIAPVSPKGLKPRAADRRGRRGAAGAAQVGLRGFRGDRRGDRRSAIAALRAEEPAVVTLDLGLPPDPDGTSEGFAVLDAIMALKPDTKVIVATGHGARESALQRDRARRLRFLPEAGRYRAARPDRAPRASTCTGSRPRTARSPSRRARATACSAA